MHADFFGQIGGLQANPDAVFELLPLGIRIEAKNSDLPAGAGTQSLENLDCGSFARAIRPQQAEHFSRFDLKVNSLDSLKLAVGFLETVDGDGWTCSGHAGTIRLPKKLPVVKTPELLEISPESCLPRLGKCVQVA